MWHIKPTISINKHWKKYETASWSISEPKSWRKATHTFHKKYLYESGSVNCVDLRCCSLQISKSFLFYDNYFSVPFWCYVWRYCSRNNFVCIRFVHRIQLGKDLKRIFKGNDSISLPYNFDGIFRFILRFHI